MEGPDRPGDQLDEEWAKTRAEAEIDAFKAAVEGASVEHVDEPTGRKEVEVAWEDEDGFHVEDGEAVGVYRERKTIYHIDWSDDRGRTTVEEDQLVDLDEGEYYNDE